MNKQGHYVRDGVDLEVIVDRKASYEEVIEKACNAFSMEKKKGCQLTLFTSGGAIVVNKEDWTLGGYLQETHRSSNNTRFGIGYVKKVSFDDAAYFSW